MSDTDIDPDKRYSAMGSVLIEYRELKRRVANLDIETAARALHAQSQGSRYDFDEISQRAQDKWRRQAQVAVNAALGTEDE